MGKQEKADPIEVRLNAIIGLLSEFLVSQGNITHKSIYQSLDHAGLTPTEVGNIFGKSRSDIGSVLTRAKQQKTKSKKNSRANYNKNVIYCAERTTFEPTGSTAKEYFEIPVLSRP